MFKAEVKEEASDGQLVNSFAVVVKEEPSDYDIVPGSDNEDRNTPTKPSLPCSDRPCNLHKRTTSEIVRKEDVDTTELTVSSSSVEGGWTEMESVVIDEELPSVKVELPSIWSEDEVEQGSSAGKPADQGKLRCPQWPKCGYTTSRPDHLKRHQAVHDYAQRSFICEKCGKCFTAKHCLDGHMAVHSDGKKRVTSQNPRRRGRRSMDEELAAEHALPVSAEKLAAMTYQEVQRLLIDCSLSNEQKALIKKIRRRGRNKVAARKSRERRTQDRHAAVQSAQPPYRDDYNEEECAAKLVL